MADAMADPVEKRPGIIRRSLGGVALKFVSRLIHSTIVTGMMAALITTADTPTVVPLACGTTWTRTGGMDLRTRLFTSVAALTAPAERPAAWS
jgi:hypothetical protein